ncbi:glycosyltransferase [Desulfovibrio ferrophilus]|uniref:Glycosyl transferase group 1 n=1 Tax=Desulfovibrio ferrophilus TaxID=241368 RepID=A0A2Z6AXH2_9BACT|nr:glycosyltransferase [Desulfovibrio ferrophilus]BBD07846.1 glycosyl transferase group 1 [Desulfovibrio ferrophilus]
MNIAFVNATRRFGGVKAWTLDLCRALDGMGHKTWIFARPGPFLDKAQAMGLDAREGWFGFDYRPLSVWRFMQFIKTNHVDALVANVGKDLRIAGIAARLCGVPVVHRVGLPRDMRDTLKVRNTHRFTKATLLSPCQFIKREMLQEVSFLSADDIHVIPTGKVPAAQAPAAVRTPRSIAVTSQLNPDKGHADLILALAELKRRGRQFHLHVAGTGRSEAELKQLAEQQGLSNAITWHGFVTDVNAILDQADIFCLPSLSEGLPNTLLESMARGLAPVARNVGGIGEAWPADLAPLDRTLVPLDNGMAGLGTALDKLLALGDEELNTLRTDVWKWFATHHSLNVRAAQFADYISKLPEQR